MYLPQGDILIKFSLFTFNGIGTYFTICCLSRSGKSKQLFRKPCTMQCEARIYLILRYIEFHVITQSMAFPSKL